MHVRSETPFHRSRDTLRERGWLSVEMLVTIAAAIAFAALGWRYFGESLQRAENRQKAIVAAWEVSAFLARAETGARDTPDIVQDGQGFELPGEEFTGRGGACLLDAGDADFAPESTVFQGVVRNCVPCDDSGGGSIPLLALGAVPCVTGGGLPKRCATQQNMRTALPLLAGSARAATPANTRLMQGIWIPADSLQDAIEIQHYFESDPQFSQLSAISVSRTGDPADPDAAAGLFICT